jgi:phage terminase large subunit-like protein
MALRQTGPKGDAPRLVVSTAPHPSPLLRALIADASTVIARSRTTDNSSNLDPATLAYLRSKYAGTTLGRQELEAELLEESDGALWTRAMFDGPRVARAPQSIGIVGQWTRPAASSCGGQHGRCRRDAGRRRRARTRSLRHGNELRAAAGWMHLTECA